MANCGTRQAYRKGCRCDACVEAGKAFLAARREREARARERFKQMRKAGEAVVQTHGITGYQRGCRCSTCVQERKEADIARKESLLPEPDWSAVAHLMPGANVRRRA
jgi:hypothetical protein